MQEFMNKDFLLKNDISKELYHEYAEKMPIFDFHCHLSPKEIAENKSYDNLTQIWLYGDHYKWRAMRSNGVDEKYVTGDAIVIMDADLQDPPELIPDMLKLWEDGNEVIYGKRKARKGESLFKLMTAKMFYNTLNALSDVDIPKDTGDFRLVDRKVVDTINNLSEHNKFLRGLFSWVGYKQYAYEYERQERKAGKTKYPLKKMLKLASDGIVSFSTKPLKIVGGLGIITIIISIIILIYSLISYACNLNQLTPRVDFNNGCNNTI